MENQLNNMRVILYLLKYDKMIEIFIVTNNYFIILEIIICPWTINGTSVLHVYDNCCYSKAGKLNFYTDDQFRWFAWMRSL